MSYGCSGSEHAHWHVTWSLMLLLWFQLNGGTMLLLEYDIATNTETVYNSDKAVVLTVRYNAAGSVTHRLSRVADKFTRHHDVTEFMSLNFVCVHVYLCLQVR